MLYSEITNYKNFRTLDGIYVCVAFGDNFSHGDRSHDTNYTRELCSRFLQKRMPCAKLSVYRIMYVFMKFLQQWNGNNIRYANETPS